MAATIVSFPPDPASVYRPMPLHVDRTDPSGSAIAWIKVADATDVSTYGNGLQVGQVFIQHATIQGSVPMQAGQTLHIYQNGGPYLGVWTCINSWGTGTVYTIIDAPAMGDFTPSGSPTSALRVYLDNYTVLVKLLIYTTPTGDPQQVVLSAKPSDAVGNAYINVDVELRDYFNYRIESFISPMAGVPVQSAHGITAIFYRLHVVEVYDSPDVDMSDPFDGTHDIHVDDTGDIATMRVAVNAVHPYSNAAVIDRSISDMARFEVAASTRRIMTLAPRGEVHGSTAGQTGVKVMAEVSDWMWFTLLTRPVDDMEVSGLSLIVLDMSSGSPLLAGAQAIALVGPHAAFAVGYGPANLGGTVAGLTKYVVWLTDASTGTQVSEAIEVTVSLKCAENRRPFAWMNKLGGIDAHTFTGREIYSTKVKRATVRKPYGAGTGYDWRERTYRAEPERTRTVSTKPLPVEYRRWLAEDMCESANVVAMENGLACPVVLLTDEAQGGSTMPVSNKPFTVEYRLGVDNLSQQS